MAERRSMKQPGQKNHPVMRSVLARASRTEIPSADVDRINKDNAAREAAKDHAAHCRTDRQGVSSLLPQDLSWKEAGNFCAQVAKRESDRLPQSESDLRLARKRVPKNRTDQLLRSGMKFEDVVRIAALKVLEQWVHVLMRHVQGNSREMIRTLSRIVHGYVGPATLSRNLSSPTTGTFQRGNSRGNSRGSSRGNSREMGRPHSRSLSTLDLPEDLILLPNPTPAAATPLGSAIRRLVPPDGLGRCEFVEDIMAALRLQDNEFVPTSPTHILRPNTALRSELDLEQFHEAKLDFRMKPDCIRQKDAADMGFLNRNANAAQRRTMQGSSTTLRLSGDCGGWATFSRDSSMRVTIVGSDDKPSPNLGPGHYKRPVSTMRTCRTGSYPSVGKLRAVGNTVMGSVIDRFA